MAGKKKSDTRSIADVAAVFGGIDLTRVDYETFVGLWLLTDRQYTRLAAAIMQAFGFAFGKKSLPASFYDAIATHPEEAEELEFAGNVERERAAALSEFHHGHS